MRGLTAKKVGQTMRSVFHSVKRERFCARYLSVNFAANTAWKIVRFVILFGLAYIILYPFLIKIINAFKDVVDFADPTVRFIPKHFTTIHIKQVILNMDYFNALRNTLLISIVTASPRRPYRRSWDMGLRASNLSSTRCSFSS